MQHKGNKTYWEHVFLHSLGSQVYDGEARLREGQGHTSHQIQCTLGNMGRVTVSETQNIRVHNEYILT